MIHIKFDEPDTQEWKKWREDCDAEQNVHNERIQNGEGSKVRADLYGRLKKTFFTNRNGVFHGKCAFCESRIRTAQHGDIEHFRPKGGIRNRDNIRLKITGSESNHPGYFWLAYDWHNLLPSCVLCNQPNTEPDGVPLGKREYFPLADENQRAQQPGEEVNETPLLINPVLQNPADYLSVDSTGVMFAKDGSPEGEMCIEIFGLNQRELPLERKRVYEDTKTLYLKYLTNSVSDPNSPSVQEDRCRLYLIEDGDEEYTIAARLAIADVKTKLGALIDSA